MGVSEHAVLEEEALTKEQYLALVRMIGEEQTKTLLSLKYCYTPETHRMIVALFEDSDGRTKH